MSHFREQQKRRRIGDGNTKTSSAVFALPRTILKLRQLVLYPYIILPLLKFGPTRPMSFLCAAGKNIPPPRPSEPNPDYVQCPHCGRRFEEFAAERHMPFCKEKHSRIERRSQDNKAMDKLNKRIQVFNFTSEYLMLHAYTWYPNPVQNKAKTIAHHYNYVKRLSILFMQYKPPKLKKKSGDQDATPSKKPQPHGNPPGYHLVPKKSNFSGTYTLEEENSPERQRGSYQPQYRAGGRPGGGGSVVRAPVPKSFSQRMMTSSHTSATPVGELPGLHYSYSK